MNKKSIIYANYPIAVLCEDFYMCNSMGDVLSARERSLKTVKNVFSHILSQDLVFLNSALNSYQAVPLVLVDSDIGPLFIDVSTLSASGVLLVILSNIDALSALYIAERCLKGLVEVSDSVKARDPARICEPSMDALLLAGRIKNIYSHDVNTCFAAHSPANEALVALDTIFGISELCGCSVIIRTEAYGKSEIQSSLCPRCLRAALSGILMIGHKYSAQRRAEIAISFSELGIRLDISFDVARTFSCAPLIECSTELSDFLRRADRFFMDCQCFQQGNKFSVALFPWQQKVLSTDLKKEKKHFE